MSNKLYRSRTDRMVGGVCSGLGRYLKLDPTIIRLFFVLLAFGSGTGVLLYLLLWVIVPYEGEGEIGASDTTRAGASEIGDRVRMLGEDVRQAVNTPNPRTGLIAGGALIVLGLIFLVDNLHLPWLRWLNFGVFWPLLLIAAGAVLIWRRVRD